MKVRVAALALLVLAPSASARTWLITPEGTGDAPTIQAGIDSSSTGDVVELANGTFTGDGNRDLDYGGKAITVRSAGGPTNCILDVEGTENDPHRAFHFHSSETPESVLEGVTIANGWHTWIQNAGGGGVVCENASPTFRSCLFTKNAKSAVLCEGDSRSTFDGCLFQDNSGKIGGAIHFREGDLTIIDCEFVRNEAELSGGALHGHAANAEITDCVFRGNRARLAAAGDFIYGCDILYRGCLFEDHSLTEFPGRVGCINLHGMVTGTFEECTFVNNVGGTIVESSKMSHGFMSNCTFVANTATGDGVIFCGESDFVIRNTIVAFNPEGRAVNQACHLTIECSNLYGNPEGDWIGPLADDLGVYGNLSEAPLFCDSEAGDLTLHEDSPCAPPGAADCGLIGAHGVECGPTPIRALSWGQVKDKYR
jgi:hypothetical protein